MLFLNTTSRVDCRGVAGYFLRKDRYAVEMICSNGSVVVEYDPIENQLTVTDKVLADYSRQIRTSVANDVLSLARETESQPVPTVATSTHRPSTMVS